VEPIQLFEPPHALRGTFLSTRWHWQALLRIDAMAAAQLMQAGCGGSRRKLGTVELLVIVLLVTVRMQRLPLEPVGARQWPCLTHRPRRVRQCRPCRSLASLTPPRALRHMWCVYMCLTRGPACTRRTAGQLQRLRLERGRFRPCPRATSPATMWARARSPRVRHAPHCVHIIDINAGTCRAARSVAICEWIARRYRRR
jgi:hypothetical protein